MSVPKGDRPTEVPTPEEVAAIVAAVAVVFERPAVGPMPDQLKPAAWRFSGRWWARPIAARRDRPW